MSDAPKPLDLDNARAALARARHDITPAAVRAPRPADLSRLQEMEARTATIDARASAFRATVRQSLGLGSYHGPATAPSRLAAHAMSTPLCDSDVCAPVRPPVPAPVPAEIKGADSETLAPARFAEPAPAPAEVQADGPANPARPILPANPGVRPSAKNFWGFSRNRLVPPHQRAEKKALRHTRSALRYVRPPA